jgi:hypothetical protein
MDVHDDCCDHSIVSRTNVTVGTDFGLLKWNYFSYNNEEVEVAVNEWLLMQEPGLYRNVIFKLMSWQDECISVPGSCVQR